MIGCDRGRCAGLVAAAAAAAAGERHPIRKSQPWFVRWYLRHAYRSPTGGPNVSLQSRHHKVASWDEHVERNVMVHSISMHLYNPRHLAHSDTTLHSPCTLHVLCTSARPKPCVDIPTHFLQSVSTSLRIYIYIYIYTHRDIPLFAFRVAFSMALSLVAK